VDERRHQPGPEPGWEESWSFDFVSGDGAFGGFVRLGLHPARRQAWYWAYLAGPGRPVVVVRDHDVEAPRGRDLEVRGDGLWAQVICETPFEHWSAGLEAFAVAIDDPARAWGDERGDPTALGLDLEWEMAAPARPLAQPGYVQPAAVHGEVLVGAERLAVDDATGWYTHTWGPPGWQDRRWWATSATLDDGTAVAARSPGWTATWRSDRDSGTRDSGTRGSGAWGSVGRTGALDTTWRNDGLPVSADLVLGDVEVGIAPVALAPVPLEAAGERHGVLVRALCSFTLGDNRGWGWSEWRQPPDASAG